MEGLYLFVNSIDHLMYGGRCQMYLCVNSIDEPSISQMRTAKETCKKYLCVNSIDHLMYGGRCQMFVVRCSNIT